MFNPSSFSPVSFSRISFNGVQAANEGRSGYWRLFFMQMQEDALKKSVKEEVKKIVETTAYEVKTPKKTVKKVEKRKVPNGEPVAKPTPIIPFRKLPTKLEPTVYDELANLPTIAIEQYLFSIQATATLYNFEAEREKRRKHRRKVAAFLLMAA